MEYTANHVILRGALTGLPEFSHENHSRKFYRFSLEVERLSGTTDILPVMAAEDVLEAMDLFCGGRIEVEGQLLQQPRRLRAAARDLRLCLRAHDLRRRAGKPRGADRNDL